MNLPLLLAAVDGVVAVYLMGWALRRERRDKPAVFVVGLVLSICAVFLLAVGLMPGAEPVPALPPAPGTPV